MNELLTQLVSLQAIDLEIDQIDNAIKSEQSGLDGRMSALAKREALINELQEQINSQQQESRTLEAEMADKMDHVRERQSKMMQVQTGREQTALLKEIEDAKKSAKENEEKIMAIMESIEKQTVQMEEEKNLLKGEKKLVTEETEKVRANIESIHKGKKKKDNKRSEQAGKIKSLFCVNTIPFVSIEMALLLSMLWMVFARVALCPFRRNDTTCCSKEMRSSIAQLVNA